ncbi:MAG: hypothetical protein ACK5OU_16665, partial [Dolichospermum sp.]
FDHPHIVKVYPELFQEKIQNAVLSCMVMEYVKGQDLDKYLKSQGNFSESAGLAIIQQIGTALESEVLNVKILRILSKLCIGIGDTKFEQLMTLFSIDNGFYLGKTKRL